MFTKLEKVIGVTGFIVMGAGFFLFHYEQRDNYSCVDCFSKRTTSQWFIGLWPATSIATSRETVRVRPSHVARDFFDQRHRHQWEFAQGSPYYLLGTVWGG